MVWLVLEPTRPGQQPEITPEGNCSKSRPRIQSGKLRPEGKKVDAPEPIINVLEP